MNSRNPNWPVLVYEFRVFLENFRRARDCVLNRTFDLSLEGAKRRKALLFGVVVLILMTLVLSTQPLSKWVRILADVLGVLFIPGSALDRDLNYGEVLSRIGWQFARFLPLLLFPYQIAFRRASLYLADIFEKPEQIARAFMRDVALGGASGTLKIRDGQVVNMDDGEESPILAFGGPGYVEVDQNSVALFEKADGRPRVVGPTGDDPVPLDGFERFRSVIDLRNQHVDLRDLKDNEEIPSRSLDGIKVSAMNVSMRFSIWRGNKERTLREPHPYKSSRMVEEMVYGQSQSVSTAAALSEAGKRDLPFTIQTVMRGFVRGHLSQTMNSRKLTEFLASHGSPEIDAARTQVARIITESGRVLPRNEQGPNPNVPNEPSFTPRPDITRQFYEELVNKAHERGLHLDWIDIGTWKTPDILITDRHLEAWKLSAENAVRGDDGAIEGVRREAFQGKTIQIIQEVPLQRYHENLRASRPHLEAVKRLLVSYLEQMTETRELLIKKDHPDDQVLIQELKEAIDHIRDLLGWGSSHQPGKIDPPNSITPPT